MLLPSSEHLDIVSKRDVSNSITQNIREVPQTPRTFQFTSSSLRAWQQHCLDALGCLTVHLREPKKTIKKPCCNQYNTSTSHRPPFTAALGRSALCLCLCFAKTSCCAAVGTCVVEI